MLSQTPKVTEAPISVSPFLIFVANSSVCVVCALTCMHDVAQDGDSRLYGVQGSYGMAHEYVLYVLGVTVGV